VDLSAVASYRPASSGLTLAPGETFLGGGTWLFSAPQPLVTGLVDLTALGWPPLEERPDGSLRVAATCTIAELVGSLSAEPVLGPLAAAAADALLMSWKVQRFATVGGNLVLALPAGAMVSLFAGLGASVVVWGPDGAERREPVATFVRGVGLTSLAPGEVVRAVDVPAPARAAPAVLRRTSLTTYGRSAAVVVGRTTDTGPVLTVTAATTRPVVVRSAAELTDVDCWYADPHGPADWRAAMTAVLAGQVLEELAA
jgi:CO/xanthine dehydrogenase FAD-binding subunit